MKKEIRKFWIWVFVMLLTNITYSQVLSKNKTEVLKYLSGTSYKTGKTVFGDDCITVSLAKGCTCIYIFSGDNICRRQVIIANTSLPVVELIADMNEKFFLKTNDVSFYEEKYGVVEAYRINNVFTFEYKEEK